MQLRLEIGMVPSLRPSSVSRRRALILLCVVQGCERFAFLAMLPLFVLYAQDRHTMPAPTALLVMAIFQALSYLGGLPAGWLADGRLGARASTLLGAALLACGYGVLVLDLAGLLWPALGMMVAGHSFFKPGLHVLIARVSTTDEQARERASLWHYLAVNLGYVGGALFGEWMHARHGWASLFGGAGTVAAATVLLLTVGPPWMPARAASASATSARAASTPASEGMRAVWMLSAVAVIFWLTAQQVGSSLTVFVITNTVQLVPVLGHPFQIGPGHYASLHGLLVLAMLPAFLALHGRGRGQAISTAGKMIWGYVATSAAFLLMAAAGLHGGDSGRVSGAWLLGCYVLLSLAEVLLAPLGVSLMTQLAPKEKAAQAVGLWFAGCALGNGLAGALGLCWDRWPHHRYFGLLALLSLGAAAALMPRRRRLDWLTALTVSAASQPVLERIDTMTSTPNLATDNLPSNSSTPSRAPSPVALVLASLTILLPSLMAAMKPLPLPVRGVSAIVGGLAVLLCGPYLFSHSLVRWARRAADNQSAA